MRCFTFAFVAMALAMLVAAVVFAFANRGVVSDPPLPADPTVFLASQIVAAMVWSAAAITMLRRPELGWSVLCSVAAVAHGAAAVSLGWATRVFVVGESLPGGDVAAWLLAWTLPVEVLVLGWMVVTVPDGRLPSGWPRWPALWTVGASGVGVLVAALAPLDMAESDFAAATNPIGGVAMPAVLPVLLLAPTALSAFVVVLVRWRNAAGDDRTALVRVVAISTVGLIVPVAFAGGSVYGVAIAQLVGVLQVLALVSVVVRHQLFGIDTVVERTVLYSLLAVALLAVYTAVVAFGDVVVGRSLGPIAAVGVALVALPARDGLGRLVARLVYGDRDRPDQMVEAVHRRAVVSGAPVDVLTDVLEELATGLRVPGLAILSPEGVPVASFGAAVPDHSSYDDELVHRGRRVGRLIASRRAGEDALSQVDRNVLNRLGAPLAVMVDAAMSSEALRRSRDELVRVREEERRRIRRDLHDGLGAILTGVTLTIDAVANNLDSRPSEAGALLKQARSDLGDAITEIRRLVEDLRPPALDELGLAGSIRQHAYRFPGLATTVEVPAELDQLPAAVEVAAYRIATEALTNTARHSGAQHVWVELRLNNNLEIEVRDNGRSTSAWTPGVGLTSMQERVMELGGTLDVGPCRPQGGRVLAALPVEP